MNAKTKGVLAYLLIAFGMAWILWEIPIRKGLSVGHPLFQFVILPGAFAPAIACIIVRKWVTCEGFADAGLKLNVKKWRYYLVGWILPLVVVFCIVFLAIAFRVSGPDFTLQRAFSTLAPGMQLPPLSPGAFFVLIVVQVMINAVIVTPLLWGEEFGWRSYLQIRLFSSNPVLAAVATGIIWGVWHYPINLRGYNFPEHPLLGLVLFPVSTILLSIIFGWLRLKSESIWPACLAHAATNAVGGSLTIYLFIGGPNMVFVTYLGILGWIPLGVLCAWIILTGRLNPENLQQ
ncbi:MAG: CPBP family intramembrane metalloprotease [Theionarchaea archaeon]|nr:MAG: hypothetical protein AYK19_07340 [Theionarchaea archaeon DG-70-1]MBU7025813.1 CPBP family intramembrane metalloprotease [Theionarchaea archaeon]